MTLGLLALTAPAARASMTQESIFEDGTVLLQQGPARQASGLDEIAALGADTVRALVVWRDVARSPAGLPPAWAYRYDTSSRVRRRAG